MGFRVGEERSVAERWTMCQGHKQVAQALQATSILPLLVVPLVELYHGLW